MEVHTRVCESSRKLKILVTVLRSVHNEKNKHENNGSKKLDNVATTITTQSVANVPPKESKDTKMKNNSGRKLQFQLQDPNNSDKTDEEVNHV